MEFLERPVDGAAEVSAAAAQAAGADGTAPDPLLPFLAPPRRADSIGRLGYYEILEVIGRGSMGVVLRAFDDKLHRVVAIKVLSPPLAAVESARRRFVREARASAAVTHDHVIAIYAVEDAGPLPYLVMQFIDGPTLQAKLDRTGPLPLAEVLRIGIQTATGLAAAHAQGLVHRDVKPGNILLENGVERVKLTDFGLARAPDDGSLTAPGVIAGTPAYMSPEQADGGAVDRRSDLFSLGSVLYVLCTGRTPFGADTALAVLRRVSEAAPRPVRELNPGVPDRLAAVITRLHAKNPADRFQTATEVAGALGELLAAFQGQPAPRAAARRRTHAIPTLLLVGLATAGVGAWLATRPPGVPPTDPAPSPKAPRRPPTYDELAARPGPLDALTRNSDDIPANAPPDVVGVLGEFPRFQFPKAASAHWMAQTADGRLLAVPSGGAVALYDARTGYPVRTLVGDGIQRAFRPAFSWDGARLAAGAEGGTVSVWDVATGREELVLRVHATSAWSVAFDAAGKRIVSTDAGGTLKVWDATTGAPVTSFEAHANGCNHIAFRPDGKRLATASLDGTCKIWDAETWAEVRTLRGDKTFAAVAWSRDGTRLAAGDDDEVRVWDADTGAVIHTLETPGKGLLAFDPDGTTLFTAREGYAEDGRHAFTRWNLTAGTAAATHELPTRGPWAFFHLSAEGRTVFVARNQPADGRVRAYDAKTGEERFLPRGHAGPALGVAASPDGTTAATVGGDQTVRLWSLAGWQPGAPQPPCRVLKGHTNEAWSVAFHPDGTRLASGGNDGVIRVWDAADGRLVHELTGHSPTHANVTFSPDGRFVTAGGRNGTINRWNAETVQSLEPWRWHVGAVRPVAYSADGKWLASGGTDGTVQLLDAATGHRRHQFRGPAFFTGLAFRPDGAVLAAVTEAPDLTLRLWNLETKAEAVLTGHTWHVLGVSFHPGGKLVATASQDGTVRLWDAAPPGKELRRFDFSPWGAAYCVTFTPDGRHLLVGLHSGAVVVLRITP